MNSSNALRRLQLLFQPLLRNRAILIVFGMTIWMTFLDRPDTLIDYFNNRARIEELRAEKQQLLERIEQDKRKKKELSSTGGEQLEKFAREEYFMKKPNEVIFIVK